MTIANPVEGERGITPIRSKVDVRIGMVLDRPVPVIVIVRATMDEQLDGHWNLVTFIAEGARHPGGDWAPVCKRNRQYLIDSNFTG